MKDAAVSVAIAGDVILGARNTNRLLSLQPDELWSGVRGIAADFWVANLETPCCKRCRPLRHKRVRFRSAPHALDLLKSLGVRAVSLSNNHAMDCGPIGLKETLTACQRSGILAFGAGLNLLHAAAPAIFPKYRVAFLGVSTCGATATSHHPGVAPYNPAILFGTIKRLKGSGLRVVVMVHAGLEYCHIPSPSQVRIFRAIAAMGADAVIGCHTHCVQPVELHQGVPIIYGLGNFVFDFVRGERFRRTRTGCVALLRFAERLDVSLFLVRLNFWGLPRVQKRLAFHDFNRCLGLDGWMAKVETFGRSSAHVRTHHRRILCEYLLACDVKAVVSYAIRKMARWFGR
ncbi:MAG: hypothetical protein DRP82_00510, partial [Planctomycetota bacterium]